MEIIFRWSRIWKLSWDVYLDIEEGEYLEEIRQEIGLCIQEQYGGHQIY